MAYMEVTLWGLTGWRDSWSRTYSG